MGEGATVSPKLPQALGFLLGGALQGWGMSEGEIYRDRNYLPDLLAVLSALTACLLFDF